MLYGFLETMTLGINLQYGMAYNLDKLLAQDRSTPVYVYQFDSIVAWELGIYRDAPSVGVQSAAQLPGPGADYILVVRDAQIPELSAVLGRTQLLAQREWVDHKTGTLPRQLNLAKGTEPLDKVSVLRVTQP
jgi:hypothetical protein